MIGSSSFGGLSGPRKFARESVTRSPTPRCSHGLLLDFESCPVPVNETLEMSRGSATTCRKSGAADKSPGRSRAPCRVLVSQCHSSPQLTTQAKRQSNSLRALRLAQALWQMSHVSAAPTASERNIASRRWLARCKPTLPTTPKTRSSPLHQDQGLPRQPATEQSGGGISRIEWKTSYRVQVRLAVFGASERAMRVPPAA